MSGYNPKDDMARVERMPPFWSEHGVPLTEGDILYRAIMSLREEVRALREELHRAPHPLEPKPGELEALSRAFWKR